MEFIAEIMRALEMVVWKGQRKEGKQGYINTYPISIWIYEFYQLIIQILNYFSQYVKCRENSGIWTPLKLLVVTSLAGLIPFVM